jgi:hypothetical protein
MVLCIVHATSYVVLPDPRRTALNSISDPSCGCSAAALFVGSRVRIPLRAWLFVPCFYVFVGSAF